MQEWCHIQALCVLNRPSSSVGVSVSPSLSSELTAVCTTAHRPVPVCLNLHCASAEAVGV